MDLKTKITDIQILPDGGAVLSVEKDGIEPFQVSADYMNLSPKVGGYYTATDGVEGFETN